MWWIIGICASDADRIIFTRVLATPEQIKQYLFNLVSVDREKCSGWDHGTESIEEVTQIGSEYYAYGSYDDFHIDYSATLESEIEEVILV